MNCKKLHWMLATCLCCYAFVLRGQDSVLIRQWMNELSSPQMHGRGYTNNGVNKARAYLISELSAMQLVPLSQPFWHAVNSFPGKVSLTLNGKQLEPGRDFLVSPESAPYASWGNLVRADSMVWISEDRKLMLQLENKLTWSVAKSAEAYTALQVSKQAIVGLPASYVCEVQSEFIDSFESANVVVIIPGKRVPDSLVAFSAHYDHLGRMGRDALFAGANDNASGTAVLLALAKRLKKEPLDYTTVCLFFAGEEAGLLGSEYFVKHPLVPLEKMRFLLNLDLMGNGEEGITVVNGSVHTPEYDRLLALHAENPFLPGIFARGKAQNSDHYWFTENRVPAFFWYTMGARKAYHDVEDIPETVPLFRVESLVDLAIRFMQSVVTMPHKAPN